MKRWITDVPVVFFIFNREDNARKVFEQIKNARPRQLFVVSDGPRSDRKGEKEQVQKVRQLIEQVDWECELHTEFADKNMGCDQRIVSGISWAFQSVERAIILEDDCVPTRQFFDFCRETLDKYEQEKRIAYISGTVYIKNYRIPYSYFYSYIGSTWGWATWKDRWELYQYGTPEFEFQKENYLRGILKASYREKWLEDVERHFARGSFPWDYIWRICTSQYLSVVPAVNLVRNIGFSKESTHTINPPKGYWMGEGILDMPLVGPEELKPDLKYLSQYQRKRTYYIWDRVIGRCRMIFHKRQE